MSLHWIIEGEKVGAYSLAGFEKSVYECIRTYLKSKHREYKQKAGAISKKSKTSPRLTRFRRLEATANALHAKLKQNKNTSIGFSLDEVVGTVQQTYRDYQTYVEEYNPQKDFIESSVKSAINQLIGGAVTEENSEQGRQRYQFRVVYEAGNTGNQHGYILPKIRGMYSKETLLVRGY